MRRLQLTLATARFGTKRRNSSPCSGWRAGGAPCRWTQEAHTCFREDWATAQRESPWGGVTKLTNHISIREQLETGKVAGREGGKLSSVFPLLLWPLLETKDRAGRAPGRCQCSPSPHHPWDLSCLLQNSVLGARANLISWLGENHAFFGRLTAIQNVCR